MNKGTTPHLRASLQRSNGSSQKTSGVLFPLLPSIPHLLYPHTWRHSFLGNMQHIHHSRERTTSAKNYGCREYILNSPAAEKLFTIALADLSRGDSSQIHSSYLHAKKAEATQSLPAHSCFRELLFCFSVQRWGHLHCLRFSCGHILYSATGFLIN